MTFTDPNATQATPVRTDNNIHTFCCARGYEFVPDSNINFNFVKTPDNQNCDSECVDIICEDEFSFDSDQQILPFWTLGRKLLDSNGQPNYNTRKVWKSNDINKLIYANQNSIAGTCVPKKCVNPWDTLDFDQDPKLKLAEKYDFATEKSNQLKYDVGQNLNLVCQNQTCGQMTAVCTATNSDENDTNPNSCDTTFWKISGQCQPKQCQVPALQFGKINEKSDALLLNHGESYSYLCDQGYYLAHLGQKVTSENSLTCEIDPNDSDCIQTVKHDYTCLPLTCENSQACSFDPTMNSLAPGISQIGDTVNCTCPTSKIQTGTCQLTCTLENQTALWKIAPNQDCGCRDPSCNLPANIPSGQPKIVENLQATIQDLTDQTQIEVGQFVTYICDSGYQLTFSHNHLPATASQCYRQCYLPLVKSCDPGKTNKNYHHTLAVLDPLNCYCKPESCDLLPNLPDHEFVNSELVTSQTFLASMKFSLFNSVKIACKTPKFNEIKGYHYQETLTCNPTWSNPIDSCVEMACPDPRQANLKPYFTQTLKLLHTCKSLDRINLRPENIAIKNSTNFQKVYDPVTRKLNPSITFAGENRLDFALPRSQTRPYSTKNNDANVKQGSKYQFHCKKGFMPYLNAVQAASISNSPIEASHSNSFECTCDLGQWVCLHHCRCQNPCHAYA